MNRPLLPGGSVPVLGSHALRLGFGFIVSLLLARSLPPSDFGVFSLFMGVLLTAAALSDFGISVPFVRFYVKKQSDGTGEAPDFAAFAYGWRFLTSLAAMAITIAFLIIWGNEYLERDLEGWVIAVGAVLVLSEGLGTFLLALLQAQRRFNALSLLIVHPNTLRVVSLTVLALAGAISFVSAFIVFAGTLFLNTIIAHVVVRGIRWRIGAWKSISLFREAVAWTPWTFAQTIANVVTSKYDLLALGAFAVGHGKIGSYALALAFGSVLNVLQTSTMTVLLPTVSGIRTADDAKRYRLRVFVITVALAIGVIGAAAAGEWTLNTFYADRYEEAPGLFLWICAAFGISTLATPWTLLTYAVDRPQIPAYQNILGLAALLVASAILVPRLGVTGMGISVLVSRAVSEAFAVTLTLSAVRRSSLSHHGTADN